MSKEIKYCPQCGYETDDEQSVFCPVCDSDEPVKLKKKPERDEPSFPRYASDPLEKARSAAGVFPGAFSSESNGGIGSPNTSLGRGNAFGGDVHVDSKVGDIHIHEEKKTPTEILTEKKRFYRAECKKYCVDGFISDVALSKLADYRVELDLDKDIANDILDEVKSLSKKVRTELSPAGRLKLEYAINAVERDDERAVSSAIEDLKGWSKSHKVDELNQMYYQLNAIVYPAKYLDLLQEDKREDYWKSFWSYVAFYKQGLRGEAEAVLADLSAWDSFYPPQDQSLLSVIGLLMRNEESAARMAFEQVTPGFSKELDPVFKSIEELLGTDWTVSTSHLSPRSKFYVKNLFREFYKDLEKRQKEAQDIREKNRAKELEEAEKRREEALKLQYQKEGFIVQYIETKGNVDKACQSAGITNATFNDWLREDQAFADLYEDARGRVAAQREKDRIESEIQAAREAEIGRLKKVFVQLYESNNCDLLKSCTETGIDTTSFDDWFSTDQGFADKVRLIRREYEEKRRREECLRRRARIKKALPYIVIPLLLVACVFGVLHAVSEKERVDAKKAAEITAYKNQIIRFYHAMSSVDMTEAGLDSLSKAAEIIVVLREKESKIENLAKGKKSDSLTVVLTQKAGDLSSHYSAMKNDPIIIPADTIRKRDGVNGLKRVNEILKIIK